MENLVNNTPICDEDKTKVCLIQDIAKYIKLHKLTPISPENFDALMDSSIEEIEQAFLSIREITERGSAPQHPL